MLDDQGFGCFVWRGNAGAGPTQVFVVSKTPRGVFNGAVYLRDFAIDGPRSGLTLNLPKEQVLRSPQMAIRGSYALGIYGVGPQYDVKAWKAFFDSFAEDGMERIYFWTSGHFPSKKFPNTYNRDGVAGTKIGSEAALRELDRSRPRDGVEVLHRQRRVRVVQRGVRRRGHPRSRCNAPAGCARPTR